MAKNILVNYTGRTGAGIAYAYEMTRGLIAAGADVYVIISKQANNYDEWKKIGAKKLVAIDTYENKKEFILNTVKFILWNKRKLKREFDDVKFTAIYVPMGTYWSYIISRLFKNIPVYYTLHDPRLHSGENIFNRIHYYLITKKEVQSACKVITLSKYFVKDISSIFHVLEKDVLVIPHAAFWNYKDFASDKKMGYEKNKINFLFFGRIEAYKGIDILINAYSKLEAEFPDKVSLTIAGKGDVSKYTKNVDSLKNIRILNYMIPDKDVACLFKGDNIVTVLPYRDATQSGVISTAFMFDSLVISTNVGALPYQLNNGEYGIIIKPNDASELMDAMKDVVQNYKKYSVYIKKARAHIEKMRWENLAKELMETMKNDL